MPHSHTIALVNGTGRQAASIIRVVSAVGYRVRAQVHTLAGVIPKELSALPNVELLKGPLLDPTTGTPNNDLITRLFDGATLAFINTTSQAGDEIAIGKALADAAVRCGTVQHLVYSSMPDHSVLNPEWPSLPLWSGKFAVEEYIRSNTAARVPATFVYAGIYNNNFTSLPYPLFCMELQADGGFEWHAPFAPDVPLPWLDAEHDVGPAVLQIFKDGPAKWNGQRIALSFETLSPNQVCAAFERALDRPCKYVRVEKIEVKVPIPSGYQHQLEVIEDLFYHKNAPFFPIPEFLNPDIENIPAGNGIVTPAAENPTETSQSTSTSSSTSSSSSSPSSKQAQALSELSLENNSNPNLAHAIAPSSYPIDDPPETPTIGPGGYSKAAPAAEGFGPGGVTSMSMVDKARRLWEGWRDMEEYAREVFPIEEEANGLDWMI
ncbi:nitrogen metabolic regulation protein [Ascosphaera apis ARSEF 7405]|uniref:Nitrogen metabolic regulation protein n=1 Tax=Ascosphaera apis ARSEF 7405 TaxID=392613 RepID=A0A167Y845_9EURO|nr:nitrogen metabolic regulation protein [Ascosphaera apis ARSEF 7405]